jgi:hypothetical protein
MTESARPRRRWGDAYALSDLLERIGGGLDFAVRDFALLTLAGHLSARFPRQLIFKGGFVLRHVHGLVRFSEDIDATRDEPPEQKLDADKVAAAIREASVGDVVRFSPQQPATDSTSSLDFDHVRVTGLMLPDSEVQVEISYREGVVDPPVPALIGRPFYEDFDVLTMAVPATDLADLAEMLALGDVDDEAIARLAVSKFELVKQGHANRVERIEQHLSEIRADYDDVVPALFPGARPYGAAMEIVWPRVKALIP